MCAVALRGGPTHARRRSSIGAVAASLALLAALVGCGSGGGPSAGAPRREVISMNCPETVLDTLKRVVRRVYREGLVSERTAVARLKIRQSLALRRAVEADDPKAAQAAVRALAATGKITNLRVSSAAGRLLADAGGPAIAPLRGVITDAGGRMLASYVASVWSDEGFIAESTGLAQSEIVLRAGPRELAGSIRLPRGALTASGKLKRGPTTYQYTSFTARRYPSGPVRAYLLKPLSQTRRLCGASGEDTLVNTLSSVAHVIYRGEAGKRTQPQVRRVQRDPALLGAVARREPAVTRLAIIALLNQHIVRLRVSAGGQLLSDVGGPFVLAPVQAPLELHGRRIGSFVLSIQDDEGYLRLAKRLAGLRVLMYMGTRLVKNSLGPSPGRVPASGSYLYRGLTFRVITVNASAFPSGPLTIRALIPIPYR
jgi:hypothetical protein